MAIIPAKAILPSDIVDVFTFTESLFIRGDANQDEKVNIADVSYIFGYLFRGYECKSTDAMDTNDDGNINLADAIYLLNYLFRNGPQPPQPFPLSGTDPTEDNLVCFPWCPWAMLGYDAQHTGRSPYRGAHAGNLKWVFSTGGSIRSSPAIDNNGNVYITSADGYLYCIQPNGELKWRYLVHSGLSWLGAYSPAIGPDGSVYVSTDDLYAFNPDGSIKWRFPLSNRLEINVFPPSPTVAKDGTIYVASDVGPYEGYLYALNPNGSLKWKSSSTSYGVRGSPAIGKEGIIYIHDGLTIYAFHPNGRLKWTGESRSYIESSFSIGPDGTIYYTGENGNLFAVSNEGLVKWESGGGVGTPAIGADGTLYLGGHKSLSCIKPDGTLKWSFEVEWNASAPAIDREGTIFFGTVGSSEHYIYAVNSDGTLKWRCRADIWVEGSPAIGPDGTIYVGSYDGKLYAIGP